MDFTSEFIARLKKHRILYDSKHSEFKNVDKKNKLWDEIAMEMESGGNVTGDVLKSKWKNLRDCYSRHLKSGHSNPRDAANIVYYKHWLWSKEMSFFNPYLKFTRKRSISATSEGFPEPSLTQEQLQISEDTETSVLLHKTEPSTLSESALSCTDHSLIEQEQPSRKRKRKRTKQSGVDKVIDFLQKRSKTDEKKSFDAIEHMFLGFAKTIKTFVPKRQTICKMMIADLIFEQEMIQQEENEQMAMSPRCDESLCRSPQSSGQNTVDNLKRNLFAPSTSHADPGPLLTRSKRNKKLSSQ